MNDFIERFRARFGRRVAGVAAALVAELLLVLLLLTLAPDPPGKKEERTTVFSVAPEEEKAATPDELPAKEDQPVRPPTTPSPAPEQPAADPVEPAEAPPSPAPPPLIQLSREQMAAADIASIPTRPPASAPPRGVAGPPNVPPSGAPDSQRVSGSGPNGEPLYAASWYREPYPEELRGYLSTSRGPGWGLIACRTVRDYRVEDCVIVGESPEGSNIARSVLAAAWQFRVRPPRVGGQVRVGEWVRIRIDYDLR